MPTRNMANRSVEALTLCRVRSSTFSLNQTKSRGTTILRPTILSIISRNICSMLQNSRTNPTNKIFPQKSLIF